MEGISDSEVRNPRRTVALRGSEPSQHRFVGLAYALAFAVLAYAKTPHMFSSPRFYAEEASHYWPELVNDTLWDALLHTHIGSYQVLSNLAVFAATRVPLEWAPTVTAYASFLFQMAVAAQIGWFVTAWRIRHISGLGLVFAWAYLPHSYEVWLTATNIQWIMGGSVLMLFMMPREILQRRLRPAMVWSLLCGLSGVPSVIPAPVFVLRGVVSRSPAHLRIGFLLGACALIQAGVIATHGASGRAYVTDPLILIAPVFMQTVAAPLLGAGHVQEQLLSLKIASPQLMMLSVIGLLLFGSVVMLVLVRINRHTRDPGLAPQALLLLWVVSLVQTFGAIPTAMELVSGTNHPRYFLLGSMCVALLFALATTSSCAGSRLTGYAGLVLICLVGVEQRVRAVWIDRWITGSSWTELLGGCDRSQTRCVIAVWPEDNSWVIDVPTARLGLGPAPRRGQD